MRSLPKSQEAAHPLAPENSSAFRDVAALALCGFIGGEWTDLL